MRSCVVTPFRKETVSFSLEQKGWLHRKQRKRKEDHCATKNSTKPLQGSFYSIQSRLISCQSFVYLVITHKSARPREAGLLDECGLMGNHRFVYEGFHHNAEVTYLAAARSTPSPGSRNGPRPLVPARGTTTFWAS